MSLPGRCIVCGISVVWERGAWRVVGVSRRRHVCPPGRPCGAQMAHGDVCARRFGHGYEHRTAYALENARRVA